MLRSVQENPGMVEDELYSVIEKSGFFEILGYKKFGREIRKQFVIIGEGKKADYVCLDEYQNAVFVIEAKKPTDKLLEGALEQLWQRYALSLKASYGVLTNGWSFIVYERTKNQMPEKIFAFELEKMNLSLCDQVFSVLKKPEHKIVLLTEIKQYFNDVEKLSLHDLLAKEYFFDTLALDENSIFGNFISSMMRLFDFLYSKSKFLFGAYSFWRVSFAKKPDKIPEAWKPFLNQDQDIYKFIFCLESAHALLARLILAKSCEDLKFPDISISNFVVEKIPNLRGEIPAVGYPVVLIKLLAEMKNQLVYSIFEEDIFSWWKDGYSQFTDMPSGEILQEKVDQQLNDFGTEIAKLILTMYKYDFSEIKGDPLGDLYQRYFDKETRKALGEFYTPEELVKYIFNSMNYKNGYRRRLIDPACGSGTFIVEALKRYLKEQEQHEPEVRWSNVLKELCNSPRIVGMDLHPFACLIAQIRFTVELLPYYIKAMNEDVHGRFYLRRIPVFRTDSLKIEMTPPELSRKYELVETTGDIVFPVILPIQAKEEKSISAKISLPSWRKIIANELPLFNFDEYFYALQAIFDALKLQLLPRVSGDNVPIASLVAYLKEYLTDKDFLMLAKFFKPYADSIINEVKRLRDEYEDGRLVKSIEDVVLAVFLKAYVKYDFVVENPPYVHQKGEKDEPKISFDDRDYFRTFYETIYDRTKPTRGGVKINLFVPFIERSIKFLESDGKFGFVVHKNFLKVESYRLLRQFVLKTCKINQIVDLGAGIFEDVTGETCIVLLEKEKDPNVRKNNKILIVTGLQAASDLLEHNFKTHYLSQEVFEENYDNIFTIYFDDKRLLIKKRIESGCVDLVGLLRPVSFGLDTIDNKKYISDKKLNEKYKPAIMGRDVARYFIKNRHRYVLYDRRILSRTGDEEAFNASEKIVMQRIGAGLVSAYDNEQHYCFNSLNMFLPKGKVNLKLMVAILNSKVMEWYYRLTYENCSKLTVNVTQGFLESLPIKVPTTEEDKEIARKIVSGVEKILFYGASISPIAKKVEGIISEWRNEGIELNEISYTFEESHAELQPIVSGTDEKGYAIFPHNNEDPILVETEEQAKVVVALLLNKNVRKNEIITILLPRDKRKIDQMLKELRELSKDKEIFSLEKAHYELNELIYRLYRLKDEDKAMIEDFVEKLRA